MPLIDLTYFGSTLPLIVAGNEPAIEQAIKDYEPDYLRAVLGQSLYEAYINGTILALRNQVYFSNQFSSQFYKGGIDIRWKWLEDGKLFDACGRKWRWPGFKGTGLKRTPLANYVYWKYLKEVNPRATAMGGFADTALENAVNVSPKIPMMRAWNEMVDWHTALWKLLTLTDEITGLPFFPELNPREFCDPESKSVYTHQLPV